MNYTHLCLVLSSQDESAPRHQAQEAVAFWVCSVWVLINGILTHVCLEVNSKRKPDLLHLLIFSFSGLNICTPVKTTILNVLLKVIFFLAFGKKHKNRNEEL